MAATPKSADYGQFHIDWRIPAQNLAQAIVPHKQQLKRANGGSLRAALSESATPSSPLLEHAIGYLNKFRARIHVGVQFDKTIKSLQFTMVTERPASPLLL